MAEIVKSGFSQAVTAFFEYDTPKIVHIKSKKVGFINRIIQLGILGYIIGYAIVWEKGYQDTEQVVSAASTKVKGVTFTNLTGSPGAKLGARIWDVADYVIPPQENDAFFVTTNAIVTLKQSQGVCPESPNNTDALCKSDADCTRGRTIINGNGVCNGTCGEAADYPSVKVCDVFAWCPVEKDGDFPTPGRPLIGDASDFTVLVKNQIEFPKFNVKRRNIPDTYNSSYLTICRYNSSDPYDRFCPIFKLGYIVDQAGENFTEMAMTGGFILIKVEWDCDLDHSIDACVPRYSFRRLDDKDSKIAKGWNFRYANYYYEADEEYRDLIKAYGIRFIIKVTGQAGKFSFVPLLLNLGSGLGLLAIATVLCDMVTLYVLKKGSYYKERKYLYVKDAEEAARAIFGGEEEPRVREPIAADSGRSYHSLDDSQNEPEDNTVKKRTGAYNRLEEEDE